MIPQTDHLIHFYANTVEGGQKMILMTTLLTRFPTNTAAGSTFNVSLGTLAPRTAILTHFYAKTAAGSAFNVSPDTISR